MLEWAPALPPFKCYPLDEKTNLAALQAARKILLVCFEVTIKEKCRDEIKNTQNEQTTGIHVPQAKQSVC